MSLNAPQAGSDYYERLEKLNIAPLWRKEGIDDPEPTPLESPCIWRWRDIHPLLMEAAELVAIGEEAERRALTGQNPTRTFGTTHTLTAGYQLVMPGEVATAHRHSIGALRLMLQGEGHTVVNGEPVAMKRGDLVLTPSMNWHDHRNSTDAPEPMIWLDVLDSPFVKGMRAGFFEEYPGEQTQPWTKPAGHSTRRYAANMAPTNVAASGNHSPVMNYDWASSFGALDQLAIESGDRSKSVSLEYNNPQTGGSILPTMTCSLHYIAPGSGPPEVRATDSTLVCVLEGRGTSIVNGEKLEWEPNDLMAVPAWVWQKHVAEEPAILFTVSDRPILDAFGLFRKEYRHPDEALA